MKRILNCWLLRLRIRQLKRAEKICHARYKLAIDHQNARMAAERKLWLEQYSQSIAALELELSST